MIKSKCENLVILLDLNSREWIELKKNQHKQSQSTKDQFDIDDLVEIFSYVVNIYLLKNIHNQVALFTFDEKSTLLIFPRDQEDYELQKMMNLIKIKQIIFERIFTYLQNKQALNINHSQLVQSFYRAICWLKKTQVIKQNQMKVYNRILVCLISNIKEEDCFNLMNCIQACVSMVSQKEYCSRLFNIIRKKTSSKTKGLYLPAPPIIDKNIVEYFLNAYLIGIQARQHFKMPYTSQASYDSACHCHKKKIKFGFLCSSCLRIYCKEEGEKPSVNCIFCGKRYVIAKQKELENFY